MILLNTKTFFFFFNFSVVSVINWELEGWRDSSDTVNFNLFNAIWTLVIALPYLSIIPIFSSRFSHIYAITVVEFVTMVFWFAGFIALAADLPPAELCKWTSCRCAQAATVIGSFEW
jgi:membrane-anchored protein YejM (alkaline phosphatase superfamily)